MQVPLPFYDVSIRLRWMQLRCRLKDCINIISKSWKVLWRLPAKGYIEGFDEMCFSLIA